MKLSQITRNNMETLCVDMSAMSKHVGGHNQGLVNRGKILECIQNSITVIELHCRNILVLCVCYIFRWRLCIFHEGNPFE